ncbi:hypothetical protein F5887DRAFT_1212543 [Amanita rubescens]|nr:hypothetical protein F5887DRAFT_1212543 [Amanita rubescens]
MSLEESFGVKEWDCVCTAEFEAYSAVIESVGWVLCAAQGSTGEKGGRLLVWTVGYGWRALELPLRPLYCCICAGRPEEEDIWLSSIADLDKVLRDTLRRSLREAAVWLVRSFRMSSGMAPSVVGEVVKGEVFEGVQEEPARQSRQSLAPTTSAISTTTSPRKPPPTPYDRLKHLSTVVFPVSPKSFGKVDSGELTLHSQYPTPSSPTPSLRPYLRTRVVRLAHPFTSPPSSQPLDSAIPSNSPQRPQIPRVTYGSSKKPSINPLVGADSKGTQNGDPFPYPGHLLRVSSIRIISEFLPWTNEVTA